MHGTVALLTAAALIACAPAARAQDAPPPAPTPVPEKPFPLPFLGEEARKRGIELPPPFGIGVVYYKIQRDIEVTDVRVGRNGAPPASVSDFAQLSSTSDVDNLNLKLDVWLLPFLNVYAIVGGVWNKSQTSIDVTLPPLLAGGPTRRRTVSVPTELNGTVGGLGITLAGGVGDFFAAADVNGARADLGFDEKFKAVLVSVRAGWNGRLGSRPFRAWGNWTYWSTRTVAKGSVADPDGGTLTFEVDQGPLYANTYGVGCAYTPQRWLDLAVDVGTDFHGGWYVALVPVFRF